MCQKTWPGANALPIPFGALGPSLLTVVLHVVVKVGRQVPAMQVGVTLAASEKDL